MRRQHEAECSKGQTEGGSTGSKRLGGQAGPRAECHRTGCPASLRHLSECFYLEVHVKVVNTGRMNSWGEIQTPKTLRLCNFPPSRSQTEMAQEEEGKEEKGERKWEEEREGKRKNTDALEEHHIRRC